MNVKKLVARLASILILFLVTAGMYLVFVLPLALRQPPTQANSSAVGGLIGEPISATNTFESEEFGLRFSYPFAWTITQINQEDADSSWLLAHKTDANQSISIQIISPEIIPPISCESLKSQMCEIKEMNGRDFWVFSKLEVPLKVTFLTQESNRLYYFVIPFESITSEDLNLIMQSVTISPTN